MPRARRSGGAATVVALVAVGFLSLLLHALPPLVWLRPQRQHNVVRNSEERPAPATECGGGRRGLWQASAAAVAGAFWTHTPEGAEAFRSDRVLNAKKICVPTIRAAYQKLEGLRDDLYLDVELETGDADSRVRYDARPADWYSGSDSSLDGPLVLVDHGSGFGCEEYPEKIKGVALVARGRCTFAQKMARAKQAGAKAVILYDQKISKQPLETQGKSGAVRSKSIATREAGDALTGGQAILPVERGVTIMGISGDEERPGLDAAMISLTNGNELVTRLKEGSKPRVLDVKRFVFDDGIDRFIKKDLKKMLNTMEVYSLSQRINKDDMTDPILGILKKDREAFAAAVRSKDYGEIRRTFKQWNGHLDNLGQWELTEVF